MDYLCHMEDKRGAQRKQWWKRHQGDHYVKWSMKRRNGFHDYRSRCIYMITIAVKGRHAILGDLKGTDKAHADAWVKPTSLGEQVLQCWREIPTHYPEVKAMEIQLMPDHIHGILFVTEHVPYHLGQVVNGFKIGCNAAARELQGSTLWEEGYHDRILSHEGQLSTMVRYLNDNPRRLWIKIHNKEFFTVKSEVSVGNHQVAMAGNRFLLDYPIKVAVQCSRSINSEEAIVREVSRYLAMARDGAVWYRLASVHARKR